MVENIPPMTSLTLVSILQPQRSLFSPLIFSRAFWPHSLCTCNSLSLFSHIFTSGLYSFWYKYLKIVPLHYCTRHSPCIVFKKSSQYSTVFEITLFIVFFFFFLAYSLSPLAVIQTPWGQRFPVACSFSHLSMLGTELNRINTHWVSEGKKG